MSTTDPVRQRQHPVTQDIPLPGNYPCLTLQLNATFYQATDQIRWVLVVREPSDQYEVVRKFVDACPRTDAVIEQIAMSLLQAAAECVYLQGHRKD